jgi:hypothetical protein
MRPNLVRIPGYDDARAEAIVRRAHHGLTGELMSKLDSREVLALGRYGTFGWQLVRTANGPDLALA